MTPQEKEFRDRLVVVDAHMLVSSQIWNQRR